MYIETAEDHSNDPENIKYVEQMHVPQDLVDKWYNIHYNDGPKQVRESRTERLNCVYSNGKLAVSGHVLELGFSFGESLYILHNWYPNVTFDALDFCSLFSKLVPLIQGLIGENMKDIWIGDAQVLPKPDNYYDFINSSSFFEHVPEDVYWKIIKECFRVLKPGKMMGVYLDRHVRFVSLAQTRRELESVGFLPINDYLFQKPL